jgi:hypothetical protein
MTPPFMTGSRSLLLYFLLVFALSTPTQKLKSGDPRGGEDPLQ